MVGCSSRVASAAVAVPSLKRSLLGGRELSVTSRRLLNLHEYQSKTLMREFNLRVQPFRVADSAEKAKEISEQFKCREYVVKAQVLAGGRGKGHFLENGFKGGVKLTTDPKQMAEYVGKMLGNRLVTHQTLKDGVRVNKVMVAESYNIARETYLAILMDREFGGPVLVGSAKGGVDIEQVAATDPDAIFKVPVDIVEGITTEKAREVAEQLGMTPGEQTEDAIDQIKKLYALFINIDATQVEINPLGVTDTGKVVMFDAKINFDDNAEFRQKEIFRLEDKSESDFREVAAEAARLNYIGMDGNIACVVNGAGLAMATMDIIKLHGGEPANFLDVGGTVTEPQVLEAFKILTSDSKVKTIFVNIFGGIVNCETIANGLVAAANSLKLGVPLVVRLAGSNADQAAQILRSSGLNIISADELDAAAKEAVRATVQ